MAEHEVAEQELDSGTSRDSQRERRERETFHAEDGAGDEDSGEEEDARWRAARWRGHHQKQPAPDHTFGKGSEDMDRP